MNSRTSEEAKTNMLNRAELRSLTGKKNSHCISIYLPTHRTGMETCQGQIKLKNLLREAENILLALGLTDKEANELISPAQQLLQRGKFWEHQLDGLALFITKDFFRHYLCAGHLPETRSCHRPLLSETIATVFH
jgi:hypothetical protein